MKKVLKISLAILILLGVLLFSFFDRNILDAMYRDAKEGGTTFNNTGKTEYIDYNDWDFMVGSGFFIVGYEEKYLRNGYMTWVHYEEERPSIFEIGTEVTFPNDDVLIIEGEYDYDTKILTWIPLEMRIASTKDGEEKDMWLKKQQEIMPHLDEGGITKKDLKEKHNYILNVVLKSWAKGNWRFPFNLLGGVSIRDHSWDFPE